MVARGRQSPASGHRSRHPQRGSQRGTNASAKDDRVGAERVSGGGPADRSWVMPPAGRIDDAGRRLREAA